MLVFLEMEVQTSIPIWVLVTLVSVMFSGLLGLFIFIMNYIIKHHNDTNKKQDESLDKLAQAVVAIKETTLVQTEILKRHDDDIGDHKGKIDKILEYISKSIKK